MPDVVCVGDGSSHGGSMISHNQDGSVRVAGTPVCVDGAIHSCPMVVDGVPHGDTPVSAITIRSFINGRLILTAGAVAGCGAVIQPPSRGVDVE